MHAIYLMRLFASHAAAPPIARKVGTKMPWLIFYNLCVFVLLFCAVVFFLALLIFVFQLAWILILSRDQDSDCSQHAYVRFNGERVQTQFSMQISLSRLHFILNDWRWHRPHAMSFPANMALCALFLLPPFCVIRHLSHGTKNAPSICDENKVYYNTQM